MIEEIARDLRIPTAENGITAAPDYSGIECDIIVPTHQPYDMDILARIKQRCEMILSR
jgi:hypothetical protein